MIDNLATMNAGIIAWWRLLLHRLGWNEPTVMRWRLTKPSVYYIRIVRDVACLRLEKRSAARLECEETDKGQKCSALNRTMVFQSVGVEKVVWTVV